MRASILLTALLIMCVAIVSYASRPERLKPFVDNPYLFGHGTGAYSGNLVHKFGENVDADTGSETIWDCSDLAGGADDVIPYAAAGETLYASSSDAGDAQTLTVFGVNNDFEKIESEVTLNGLAFVQIGTASDWRRVYRAFNQGSGADALAGDVYISSDNTDTDGGADGIPDDGADIRACITQGKEQTLMTVYTTAVNYVTYLTQMCSSVISPTTPTEKAARLMLMQRNNQSSVGTFRPMITWGLDSRGTGVWCKEYSPPKLIAPATDLHLHSIGSTANSHVTATFDLIEVYEPPGQL